MVAKGEVIVCEGYTDVIAFHRAGMPRAVATCGTALADEHMAQLKNFARRIILAYDADAAGQGAAEKFYGWEQKLELDIHVLRLAPGTDPGELGANDPEALRTAVAEARPFLDFRLERLRDAADLSTNEGRARFSERALEVIAVHPSGLVRDQYLMQVSDWARLGSADRLRERIEEVRRSPRPPEPPADRRAARRDEPPPEYRGDLDNDEDYVPPPPRPAVPGHGAELEVLRLAVHDPAAVAHLLEEVLFEDPVHVAAFRALLAASTLQEAIEGADPAAEALLHRLAVEEPDPTAEPDDVLAILVRRAAQREIAALEAEARASQQVIDLSWPKRHIEALADSDRRVEAAGQLVAWLSGEGQREGG